MAPNIWLEPQQPNLSSNASFVEYLRWMRFLTGDGTVDSGTILELFDRFRETATFTEDLNRRCARIRRLADESFEASCPWRVRVGGTRGPEQMLLPAFDALGLPYIPSSTLKGVARNAAAREANEAEVKRIFGTIDGDTGSMGQVVFLDAYPTSDDRLGGLQLDMANQIWKWDGDSPPEYNTNPNTFVSLEKPTFVIGLRRGFNCDEQTFARTVTWLKKGLIEGIGAQVNTGYGTLETEGVSSDRPIFRLLFDIEGQLIHGNQQFKGWNWSDDANTWKPPGQAIAELRPTAFRSVMRYWFRVFALGILSPRDVRDLELKIFGGIEPEAKTGLFRLELVPVEEIQKPSASESGRASGQLVFKRCQHASYQSSDAKQTPKKFEKDISIFLKKLTWLMFHLGGVGQGARRPCYDRRNRPRPPYWRGATLIPDHPSEMWQRPRNVTELKNSFRNNLRTFYKATLYLKGMQGNPRIPNLRSTDCAEVADENCRIVAVSGPVQNAKPFALWKLHEQANLGNGQYDPELCGSMGGPPSPIWIAKVDRLQVVTIFDITNGKRFDYFETLTSQPDAQILFPLG